LLLQLQEGEEKRDGSREGEEDEGRRDDINYAVLDKSALSEGDVFLFLKGLGNSNIWTEGSNYLSK
jgi:hypothetical protein